MKRAPTSIVVSLAKKEGQGSGLEKLGGKNEEVEKRSIG